MSDFNYDQFSLELLSKERLNIHQEMAYLEYRCGLIEQAIGKKALEASDDSVLQLFTTE